MKPSQKNPTVPPGSSLRFLILKCSLCSIIWIHFLYFFLFFFLSFFLSFRKKRKNVEKTVWTFIAPQGAEKSSWARIVEQCLLKGKETVKGPTHLRTIKVCVSMFSAEITSKIIRNILHLLPRKGVLKHWKSTPLWCHKGQRILKSKVYLLERRQFHPLQEVHATTLSCGYVMS